MTVGHFLLITIPCALLGCGFGALLANWTFGKS